MPNIVALTDNTAHGAPIIVEPTNNKVSYNGKFFACIGGMGPAHVAGHVPVSLINVIVNPQQTKVTFNGIPFAVYGAICVCGDVVIGSQANPKVMIN